VRVFGLALKGIAAPDFNNSVDEAVTLPLGKVQALFDALEAHGVVEVVLAGGVSKASLIGGEVEFDERGRRLLAGLPSLEDDRLLAAMIREFESAGIRVLPQAEWVPELKVEEGVLGAYAPSEAEHLDIRFGLRVAETLGGLGAGQCAIVRRGCVLALETVEGTDATIRRAGESGAVGAVVVKVARPDQDPRIDLPVVGPGTIEAMRAAGATVLAVRAGDTLLLDRSETRRAADASGIAFLGVGAGQASRGGSQ
jgi:DUF1009 family protein